MTALANILIVIVAILHLGFLALEMFFWDHPFGRKRFGMTAEYSKASASLAANQGLYNGFLAAGLFSGLLTNQFSVKMLFLLTVVIAAIYACSSTRALLFFIQA